MAEVAQEREVSLACEAIRKRFGGFVAVHDVSLAVGPGEILGIAGPNGAGKTTLFDVLSGHANPESGRVELSGRDVTSLSPQRRARLGLARTFQSPLVPSALTVGETLDAARRAWLPRVDEQRTRNVRALVHLSADDSLVSGQLDTLNRRKLLLACLLLREPTVVLLDEPCSGLLQGEIDEIDQIIRSLTETGRAGIVVVEHRLELLTAIADRVIVMDEGLVIAEGAPTEVFSNPAVRQAYFEAPREAA